MIKEINIKYCESNEKYDLIINGEWYGKFYTLQNLLNSIPRKLNIAETGDKQ